ncbi:MAG: flagellar basal body-associated FliL family protein [Sneathiellaceae bacterium]|uniref:flagellar basal body-associated FliL family protein n=1 Tax=Marinovum algicola TaxID=42444 RepID=UPI0032EDF349
MADNDDEEGEAEGAPKKKWSGKRLVLLVVLPLVLVLGGIGGAFVAGVFDGLMGGGEEAETHAETAAADDPNRPVVFYDLPEILVNLNSGGRQTSYLKLRVALELEDPTALPNLERLVPRVMDNFQIYLRELRPEDVSGSAGLYRIKEELLYRINTAVRPIKVNDVLFKEMIVQS